jgi:hypothetical protein
MPQLKVGNNIWELPDNHLLYIGAPYTHSNPDIVQMRMRLVNSFCADLMRRNIHLFSPLSMCHDIATSHNLPTNHLYWWSFNRKMLGLCSHLVVLMLPYWGESQGLLAEIELAEQLTKPIIYV